MKEMKTSKTLKSLVTESSVTLIALTAITAAVLVTACAPANPNLVVPNPPPPAPKPAGPVDDLGVRMYEFAQSEATFTQSRYDENIISAYFQVTKDGKSVNDVNTSELRVQESSVNVSKFSLAADREKFEKVADIVFLVDVTTSMGPFIEAAKARLKEFIKTSRDKGFHTRMCISQFGDKVVKACDRFYDNNPRDPSTEAQNAELNNELASLRALKGANEDPGWPDIEENSMGALIEAGKAPWGADSQRFVILVTDAPFLYSPNKQGKIGNLAPHMRDVTKAIQEHQMKVFAIAPSSVAGFNSPFQGERSVVKSSDGEFFEFKDVVAGRISLRSILDRILFNIQSTYKLTYTIEKNAGLNPSLPVAQRDLKIGFANSERGQVTIKSVLSSMPTGRPQYQQNWKVTDQAIEGGSLKVYLENRELGPSEYRLNGSDVQFAAVPKPGAKIRFVFYYDAIEKNLRLEPLTVRGVSTFENTKVFLNEKEARREDVVFERDMEGNTSVRLAPTIMVANDPYDIRANKRLKVRLVRLSSK